MNVMENFAHLRKPNRTDLMAGIIEHLACYIQSGRARSANHAALLLEQLAQDGGIEESLRQRCQQLGEVLDDAAHHDSAMPGVRVKPYLISWEDRLEAA